MSPNISDIRKKVTKTYELITCSYHEAGHTIYTLLHLMRVNSVSVFENKKIKRVHGITYYDYPIDFDSIQDTSLLNALVRADIGNSYAGLIAEKSLFRSISGSHKTPMFISDGSADDNKGAREMIEKYNLAPPGRKRAAFKAKLMRGVQHELHTYWGDVTIVAHALFRHRKLSYLDLQEMLTKRSKNKKFWKDQFKNISYFYDNSEHLDENYLSSII